MNDEDTSLQQLSPNRPPTESTIVAIISIVFAAAWIAFAYSKGTDTESATGDRILLIHPMVGIVLIILLIRVRSLLNFQGIVDLHILMISFWVFNNLLGILMPFILGFGIAYLVRFFLDVLQDIPLPKGHRLRFCRGHARVILTVFILGVFVLLFLYVIPQIGKQSREMSKGLVRFYHQSIVPFVIGNEFNAIVVQSNVSKRMLLDSTPKSSSKSEEIKLAPTLGQLSEETQTMSSNEAEVPIGKRHTNWSLSDTRNGGKNAVRREKSGSNLFNQALYLGTQQGIYRFNQGQNSLVDVTPGDLVGQSIQAMPTATYGRYQLLVGTSRGLYGLLRSQGKDSNAPKWHRIGGNRFADQSVQTIATSFLNLPHVFVGTENGLFSSIDNGETWERRDFVKSGIRSIIQTTRDGPRTYALTDNRIFYTDDGENWLEAILNSGLENLSIHTLAISTEKGEHIYAGTDKGMYRWRSQNEEWSHERNASLQLPDSIKLLLADSHGGLYAGNENAIFHRPNSSADWKLIKSAEEGILSRLEELPIVGRTVIAVEGADGVRRYLKERLPTVARTGSEFVGKLLTGFSSFAVGLGGLLATVSLTLMVFIYASQSFLDYVRSFIKLFPEHSRPTVRLYLAEIDKNLRAFLKGQVTVILIISIISIVIYSIIGVPFALVVGILAGLCNAIPTFGPYIGGAFALLSMLMGFAAGNFESVEFLIRVAMLSGAIFGIQALDNSLISPKVMSNAVDVDPLMIMFGVILGAVLLGFWGVLLAIPIIVVTKSVFTVSKQILEQTES